jgi:phosphatidate cytidylyltransferase
MMTTVASLTPWVGGALVTGGLVAAASRRRELILRWCFWAVGVPTVVGVFWWGDGAVAALAVAVAVVASWEYGGLVRLGHLDRLAVACAVSGVVLVVWIDPGRSPRWIAIFLLVLVVAPVVAGDRATGLRRATTAVFGMLWLSPLAALVPLGATALVLFVAVSLADITAYFVGPLLGGPHLSPVSPAKRWSGTVVGGAVGLGAAALLGVWTWPMGIAVVVGGPTGDLVESMVKRESGATDSGNWLAGAGGLLDRLDSTVLALAVLVVLG